MGDVYILSKSGESAPMERVRCVSEDIELQTILEKNHDLLPGDQIDPKNPRRWLLIKREMPVPDPGTATDRWNLDFLFADQDAIPTLVECKRFSSTEARRQVVGQIIEYASNGHHYWGKNTLRKYAEESEKNQGRTLDETLRALQGPDFDSLEVYFDLLESNLRDGRLRIVSFLEESPMELRSVVDFLSKHLQQTEILLVEARQYRSGETLIVVPTLFGYTEEARKEIQTIAAQLQTTRRQWDEDSFFADAQARLGAQAGLLRTFYDQLDDRGFGLEWGTGQKVGTFNPKAYFICPRSLITVDSTGGLQLNLGWLPDSCADKLRSLAVNELGLKLRPEQKYPAYSLAEWVEKMDGLANGLSRIADEIRAAENTPGDQPDLLVRVD
jgi:hypothetical protein